MQTILFTLMIIFMHAKNNASKDVLVKTKNGKSYMAKLGTAKNGVKDYKSMSSQKGTNGSGIPTKEWQNNEENPYVVFAKGE